MIVKLITALIWFAVITNGLLLFRHIESTYLFAEQLGIFKTGISLCKYVPQVYMNYRRRSTLGWSIESVLLDFTGGLFSLFQIIADSCAAGENSPPSRLLLFPFIFLALNLIHSTLKFCLNFFSVEAKPNVLSICNHW
jgi:hypothetical protein